MTNNGRFLMLPKPILDELSIIEMGWFCHYLRDKDLGRDYSKEYYRFEWGKSIGQKDGLGRGRTLRLIELFDNALANMDASHFFAQKQADNLRTESGQKADSTKAYKKGAVKKQADNLRTESGQKADTIRNQDQDNKERDINISKEKKFTPPTLQEISSYIAEKKLSVDAQKFFDYFDVSEWVDSKGNKVRNWKQKLITWHSNAKPQIAANNAPSFKDEILQRQFISDKIKEALKGQGIDWLDLVNKKAPMPKGINYETVKDQYRNTLYIFYPTQETNGELIECA